MNLVLVTIIQILQVTFLGLIMLSVGAVTVLGLQFAGLGNYTAIGLALIVAHGLVYPMTSIVTRRWKMLTINRRYFDRWITSMNLYNLETWLFGPPSESRPRPRLITSSALWDMLVSLKLFRLPGYRGIWALDLKNLQFYSATGRTVEVLEWCEQMERTGRITRLLGRNQNIGRG